MANHKGKRKRSRPRVRQNTGPTCPVCNSGTGFAYMEKAIAEPMMIAAGEKLVCNGKFIYNSDTTSVQFKSCYGIPVEFGVKCAQNRILSKEMVEIYKKFATEEYIKEVQYNDPFFQSMKQYIRPEIHVTVVKDELADPLAEIDEIRGNKDE